MKFPVLKASIFWNVVIAAFSLFVSFFSLLFGLAHIFGEGNPDVPKAEQLIGVVVVAVLCIVGVFFFILAISAIKGILLKIKEKKAN